MKRNWRLWLGISCLFLAPRITTAQQCPYAEPAADFCLLPRVIPGTTGHHVVLMDASAATETGTICGKRVGKTVWFEVTPAVSGPMTVSTCHPATSYDTVVQVYSGGDAQCEWMTPEDCEDDTLLPECANGCSGWGSVVTINAVAGVSYHIEVGAYGDNSAGCALCLGLIVTIGNPCGSPSFNVACSLAHELPGTPGTHEAFFDVSGAFLPVSPSPECSPNAGHAAWFKMTPETGGQLTFTTCHPNTEYDTVVQAFRGDCTGFLQYVICNDDVGDPACSNACGTYRGSTVSFEAVAGTDYYFAVGSYDWNSAGCELCLGVSATLAACTNDDDCEDGNPCTADACESGSCTNTELPYGYACPDEGVACTDDVCSGGGECIHPPKPAGSPCGDPSYTSCTYPDWCDGLGTCLPRHVAAGQACESDGNDCTRDECDGDGACTHWAATDGTVCTDDGAGCTRDICQGGVCTHPSMPNGSPCGSSSDTACDNPDTCLSGQCRPNLEPAGTICRAAIGPCDVSETCTGESVNCPPDGFVPAGTVCRAANGPCDVNETCTGTSANCPSDGFLPASTVCRAANGPCDKSETCTGASAYCPTDGFLSANTVCRAATNVCDAAESCTGGSAACPANQFAPAGTACPNDGDECTRDVCNGTGSCTHPVIPDCCPDEYECCINEDCNDGLFCNGTETCSAHLCYRGAMPCPPGSACVEESDRCGPDCNGNGADDGQDIATGRSVDTNGNGVPDECEPPAMVELLAIEDATVDSGTPNTNWGAGPDLRVGWNSAPPQLTRRSLIKFPPLALPPTAYVTSAVLQMRRLEGQPGVVGRVEGEWSEYEVTWDTQPRYGSPTFPEPISMDPDRWDVTQLVAAWQSGLFPNDGLALLETAGADAATVFISKEGGAPARLIITYAIGAPQFDPLPPPGLGPPNLLIDPALFPFAEAAEPMLVDGEPVPQPLAVLQAEQDSAFTFVANQVIITPANPEELSRLLSEYNGRVLRQPGLPAPPPSLAEFARTLPPERSYLVQVDPSTMDLGSLDADAAAMGLLGDVRVSSEQGLRLLALVLHEQTRGTDLSLNAAGQLVQAFPPLTLDEDGLEDPINDASTYPEISDITTQRTRVNRAWQYLAFATRATRIPVAIIDGGFCLTATGQRCTDAGGRVNLDLPVTPLQYDFLDDDRVAAGENPLNCSGGSTCPHHGSGTSSIATATRNNNYGIAGVGSPVAEPLLFKMGTTMFPVARAIRTATLWGAGVTSMSLTFECGWACRWNYFSGYSTIRDAMIEANNAGVLTVAAAGNENVNLEDEFKIPCQFAWTGLCVGALANNSLQRANFQSWGSNWGWKGAIPGSGGVGIFAPGAGVRVGPNLAAANNHGISGTSIATPFVAGAAALARAVNPSLTDDQVRSLIMTTAVPAVHNETQPGSIDVFQVVRSAGPPHTDVLGSHWNRDSAAAVTNAGLQNLTITPGEVDYFVYEAGNYLASVRVAAVYVEPIGDLFVDSIDPTAASAKVPALRTTSFEITSQDLCAGDSYSFFVRGANPAVGNAYNVTVTPNPAMTLRPDVHEPNNSSDVATQIVAPHESSMDILSTDPIDCRLGLTLHHVGDVDHYRFTVLPADLDQAFTGVSVQIYADFPLTATLFREGVMIQSITGSSVSLDIPQAQAGNYHVEVHGNSLNAYVLRARVYDPRGRIRAWELEDWLESQLLPDPPDLLPDCRGGCPPMPEWLRDLPFDPQTLLAIRANAVTPLLGGSTTVHFELGSMPAPFVLGSTSAGEFHLRASLEFPAVAEQAGGVPPLHAVLLDAEGTELWRVEDLYGTLDRTTGLDVRRSYLLMIAGSAGLELWVSAELPPMAGDSDRDGDADLRDIAEFQRCFGAGGVPLPPECRASDLSGNAMIDLDDVAILDQSITGPC